LGKLLNLAIWSRPDILNATLSLSKYLMKTTPAREEKTRVMHSFHITNERGITLPPKGE
jgi:hypothetical protein